MSSTVQYILFIIIIAISLAGVLVLIKVSFTKHRNIYINSIEDFSSHSYRYTIYFWGVGIFIPASELFLHIFKVRKESELAFNIIAGIICLGIGFSSQYFKVIRDNLHKLFVCFFIIYNAQVLYKIGLGNQMDFLTLSEYSLISVISYYVFYKIRHFYIYFLSVIVILFSFRYFGIIPNKDFIIYFNASFIAFIINYVIYYIDLNIKENLFFAYNFVNKGNLLVIGVNKEGVVKFVSENLTSILKYNKEEWIGKDWEKEIVKNIFLNENEGTEIRQTKLKDGNFIFMDWREEVYSEDLIIKTGRDITELKETETELKRTKELLEQTNRVARVGGWEIDIANKKLYFSLTNNTILEAPPGFELELNKALNFYKEGESRQKIIDAIIECYKNGTPFSTEVQIITLKNNEKWVRAIGQAEFEDGICKRLYGTFQDIDEQVKLVQIIKDKELQYRTLISNISSVAFRCLDDEQWTMVFISDAIEHLTGFPATDFISNTKRSYLSIIHLDDRNYVNTSLAGDLDKEYSIEYRIFDVNGKILWVNEKGRRYFDKLENRYLLDGIISDITQRKETEIALIQSYEELKLTQEQLLVTQVEQEKFVSLVKNADAFIAMADMNKKVFFLNEKAKELSGFGDGFHHTFIRDYYPEKTLDLFNNIIIPHVFKNKIWRGELEVTNSKTKDIRITDSTMFLVQDPRTNQNVAFATIQIDITERKKAEAKIRINQQLLLEKSEVLAAISKITEKLLVSKNIEKTLDEAFAIIGEAANVDRVYFFENDLKTNLITQKIEWVRKSIESQLKNPATHELSFEDIYFYTEPLLQNKIFQKTLTDLTDQKLINRWQKQNILSVLLLPIFIKEKFHGFIGFDDCTEEQIWSDDLINILQSLATNIANAIERINNEKIIAESENNFRQLNETLEDVFFLYDMLNRKYIYISPSCERVLGETQEYFYFNDNYVKDFLFEEDQNINNLMQKQLFEKGASEVEYKIKTSEGSIKWIQEKTIAIYNQEGTLVRISGICSDITEKKLIQSEIKQLSLVAEKTTNGVIIADIEGRVIWANQGFHDMMEVSAEKIIGKRPRDLFNNGTKEFDEKINNIIEGNNSSIEIEVLTYKKKKKWVQINTTIIRNDTNEAVQQVEVIIDITEQKKSQQLLFESQQKLSSILNSLDEVVWAISVPDYEVLFVSQSFERVFGQTAKQWKKNFNIWKEVIVPEDKIIGEQIEYDVTNFGSAHGIYRIVGVNGHLKWLENATKMVRNEKNEPFMIMGITTDITEKKRAEEALQRANEGIDAANRAKAELELRALQMQMNPHFIFNALNSIQSYVMSQDAFTANNYLSKFARLIRLFLDSSRSKFIPLYEEINLLTLYIELEKFRFENKFDFEILIHPQVNKFVEIPTMILQPFVENAINHGLRYKHGKGLLSIQFYFEKGFIICKIEDNGVGRKNAEEIQSKSSKGYKSQGLKITTERLIIYNSINEANIAFSIKDKIPNPKTEHDEVGTVIEIHFPEN